MATEQEVGIKITARDLTSKTFKAISGSAKLLAKAVNGTGNAVLAVSRAWGTMTRTLYQGVELFDRWSNYARRFVAENIAASMQFRKAGDPMKKWWVDQGKQVEQVRAKIGDIFLPALRGLSEAFNEVGGSVIKWLQTNRKVMATKLVEWVGWLGEKLAGAVRLFGSLAQVGLFVRDIFLKVVAALNTLIGFILRDFGVAIFKIGGMAEMLGAKGIGAKLKEAGSAVSDWGKVFESSAADALEGTTKTEQQIAAVGEAADATANKIAGVSRRARELGRAAAESDTGSGGVKPAAAGTALARLQAERAFLQRVEQLQLDHFTKVYQWRRQFMVDTGAIMKKAAKEEEERLKQLNMTIAASGADAFGSWAMEAAKGTTTATENFEAFRNAAISTTRQAAISAIRSYAASSAGAAFFSQAGIPIIGPALATAAAGAAFALVSAYSKKMAVGGVVSGGVPGRDSVPIVAMPGERVLNRSEARRYEQGERAGRQQVNITIAPQLNALSVPTRDQQRAVVSQLASAIEEAISDGTLRLGSA